MTADLQLALAAVMDDAEFVEAMHRCALAYDDYRQDLPHIPYAYTRTQLVRTNRYEVVAMRWAPGSVSPIHDHGTSRCWVLMLEGALDVENFERESDGAEGIASIRPSTQSKLRPTDVDHRFGPLELHRVRNLGAEPAFSLQLYAEPLVTYSIVDPQTRTSRLVTAACDAELHLFP